MSRDVKIAINGIMYVVSECVYFGTPYKKVGLFGMIFSGSCVLLNVLSFV